MASDNELVPIASGEVKALDLPDWWTHRFGDVPFITSISTSGDAADRDKLYRILTQEGEASDKYVNVQIGVVHVTFYPAGRVERDGLVKEWIGTKIETDDGKIIEFGSTGVYKSLRFLQRIFGPAPWHPPMKLILRSTQLSDGKRWLTFERVIDGKPQEQKKQSK